MDGGPAQPLSSAPLLPLHPLPPKHPPNRSSCCSLRPEPVTPAAPGARTGRPPGTFWGAGGSYVTIRGRQEPPLQTAALLFEPRSS